MISLDKEKISQIYWQTALKYNNVLNDLELGKLGREYLTSRGFTLELANSFMVGFAPLVAGKQFLYASMTATETLGAIEGLISGVLTLNKEKGLITDYFGSGRIILPIFENGKITTFSARSIFPDTKLRYKTLKSGRMGLFNSIVLKENHPKIYICEGIIDSLSLISMGFPAIGILGLKTFGKEHLSLFDGFTGEIVFCFDNDSNEVGQNSIYNIAKLFYEYGLEKLYFKNLPKLDEEKKMDLNMFHVKHSSKAFLEFLKLKQIEVDKNKLFKLINEDREKNQSTKFFETTDIDIISVIGKFTELSSDGNGRARCVCPFSDHSDNTPSFVVYINENRFKCYGCGRYGNAAGFLSDYLGISYKQAMEKIYMGDY